MRGRLSTVLVLALLAASLPARAAAAEPAWTAVTPAPAPPENLSTAGLWDVAAVSPADVWAVGNGWTDTERALIMHWTGTGWQRAEEPATPNFQYGLSAVDAVSARDVWAVGNGTASPSPGFGSTAVVAHYDGTAWSLVPVPAPPAPDSDVLADVDMVSTADGWAVGWRGEVVGWRAGSAPEPVQPHVMRWRNGRWVTVRMPQIGGGDAMLQYVHARAGNDVWAVGSAGDSALVMHFDGTRWTRIAVPRSGEAADGNELVAVTAVSATDVWAVGDACVTLDEGSACRPLILHLSAGVWREVPPAGDAGTHLRDVVARSAGDVWAVGYDLPPAGQESNHVEHWDGQRFVTVPVDDGSVRVQSGLASALSAVTRLPGTTELWAVGWQDDGPRVIRHG